MNRLKKTMLVDDSEAVNKINKLILEDIGCFEEVLYFHDSIEALNSISNDSEENLPSVIFLDIEMPNQNGFDFLKNYGELNVIKDCDELPLIVLVSDHLGQENLAKSEYFKSYGVYGHVRKPLEKQDVIELLEEYFEDFEI